MMSILAIVPIRAKVHDGSTINASAIYIYICNSIAIQSKFDRGQARLVIRP